MWYFAYDWRTDWRDVERRGRLISPYFRGPRSVCAGVLRNHRLCFPVFSALSAGGAANIAAEPGKFVAGSLYEVGPGTMAVLDQIAQVHAAELGVKRVVRREVVVEASARPSNDGGLAPLRTITAVRSVVHELVIAERTHVPPSDELVTELIRSACRLGHSELWIAQLQSLSPGGMR